MSSCCFTYIRAKFSRGSLMDNQVNEYGRPGNSSTRAGSNVFVPTINTNDENEVKQRADLVEWLNNILPDLNLSSNASDEEFRGCLSDGSALCQVLNRLRPGSVIERGVSHQPSETHSENVKRFLAAMDQIKLPRFKLSDLEKGSMKSVLECLFILRAKYAANIGGLSLHKPNSPRKSGRDAKTKWQILGHCLKGNDNPQGKISPQSGSPTFSGEERQKDAFDYFQGSKISELMKSSTLDNAPTQSLLGVMNGILDDSVERKSGEIPHRVACLLRKIVQEIERRISTQAEHLKTQNNLFKVREEKYQSRIKVLEALASGSNEEAQVAANQLQQIKQNNLYKAREEKYQSRIKELEALASGSSEEAQVATNQLQQIEIERMKMDEKKKGDEQEIIRLVKEREQIINEVSALKHELEMARKMHDDHCSKMETETKGVQLEMEKRLNEVTNLLTASDKYQSRIKELEALASGSSEEAQVATNQLQQIEIERMKMEEKKKGDEQEIIRLVKEREQIINEVSALKHELEMARKMHEDHCSKMETETKGVLREMEKRLNEVTNLLTVSESRVKDLEEYSDSKNSTWNKKEDSYRMFTGSQLGALQELRSSSQLIKRELFTTQKSFSDEFQRLGIKLKALADASENYRSVLSENRKLHNELQELKGNIRVYCRIRPFLSKETEHQSIVESIGEFGELTVANPSRQGKDGQRLFKFNKVYGPTAAQAKVYSDIQPLIRSVLDGYNVCIFAYGQTGSGKTHTMTGPNGASPEEWGVNYRALNDIFQISQARRRTFTYDITVQMIEIYNEQVRDLLSSDGAQKRLGIVSTLQPNGLAVPDASMHPVKSTNDVVELMDIGLQNRASGATAMNERSSRSHSIVTIHICGTDSKTNASLRGSLHLVDLAGSERVDRSEATGDRLKEAQHINKSLSALGDVIFALSQKSAHIPYRNSKLTQVLQSSLGGHAKTLMFVQLNPESSSYSESTSTLKFAERVSGVELGAAKSSRDVGDAKELMEQVAYLKDTITRKDEEIERLQLLKDVPSISERRSSSLKMSSSSPRKTLMGGTPHRNLRVSVGKEDDSENLGLEEGEYDARYSDEGSSSVVSACTDESSVDTNVSSRVVRPSDNKPKLNASVRTPRAPLRSPKGTLKSPSTSIKKSSSGSNLSVRSPKSWK